MYFVTSDLHFNHMNILPYEPEKRPFATIEEMNEALITNWNNTVSEDDTVFVLGDMFMGQYTEIPKILSRLKGKIILIRGNHDTPKRVQAYKDYGIEVHDIYYLPYKGRFFVMCHFPIASEEFMNMVREDNSEVILLYGHIHSKGPEGLVDGTYHVGVDTNNLTPVRLDAIRALSLDK